MFHFSVDVPSPPLSDCSGISNSSRVQLMGSSASSWWGSTGMAVEVEGAQEIKEDR